MIPQESSEVETEIAAGPAVAVSEFNASSEIAYAGGTASASIASNMTRLLPWITILSLQLERQRSGDQIDVVGGLRRSAGLHGGPEVVGVCPGHPQGRLVGRLALRGVRG